MGILGDYMKAGAKHRKKKVLGGLTNLYNAAREKTTGLGQTVQETYAKIEDDAKVFVGTKTEKLTNLIDGMVQEDYFVELWEVIKTKGAAGASSAKESIEDHVEEHGMIMGPIEAVKSSILDVYQKRDEKLNERVMDKEGCKRVAFYDGIIEAYTGVKAKRRKRSDSYNTHAKYGKVFGYITILPGFLAMPVLGLIPAATHGYKYLNKKMEEVAKEKTAQEKEAKKKK
jgi:hypothetical protein